MEEFYYEESNPKHVFIKCLICLFIIGIGIGVFLFYKNKNTISLKTITIEVGKTLSTNIDDYLKNGHKYKKDYKLYLDGVDTNKVGKYTYKVKYNKHTETGIIKVVDTTSPNVQLDDITIGINEEFDPNVLLLKCDDKSLPCNVSFVKDSDSDLLKKEGTYNIEFNISDAEGNLTKSSSKIIVSATETLSSKMTSDLDYYSNSENDDTIEHIFFEKLDKAINEDTLEYEGMIQEISAIDFNEYVEGDIYSTKLITVYNRYGYVIGIQVEVTYNDGTKELLQNKEIINEEE